MRSTVVVGYDRSLPSGWAVLEAGRAAEYRDADVTVVHAYWRPPLAEDGVRDAAIATAAFGAAIARRHHPGLTVRSQAAAGDPQEVLAVAARGADLLVLGARGDGGFAEQSLGSATARTLARTPCPTMVVRNPQHAERGIVLSAVDLDDPAEQILHFAFAEARRRRAALRVISAYDLGEIRTALDDTVAAREICAGILSEADLELKRIVKERQDLCSSIRVGTEVVDGPAGAVLTDATARADVLVVGAHRLDGEHRGVRIGPVNHALLRHASCPLLVVPHGAVPKRRTP